MHLEKELVYREYLNRENEVSLAPYNPEFTFYHAVQQGDIATVKASLSKEVLSEKEGLGQLSAHPLQSLKYHFAITTALVSRYCISGGMEHAAAYHLSDFYIQKGDCAKTAEELSALHATMCIDYTTRMRKILNREITSIHILKCLDYIYEHLHTRISLDTLSAHVNLSPNYLSRLFRQETGYTISQYIQRKKIETAENMLIYSEYTPAEIAQILAFPSQSYFTSVFHKHTGMTPILYRNQNLRAHRL